MKKLLFATTLVFGLTGCEGFGDGSWNPFDDGSAGRTAEQRAQQCANQGLRPGTEKFRLCLDRTADKAMGEAPVPKKKPVKAADAKTQADSEGWTDRVMNNIGSLFK